MSSSEPQPPSVVSGGAVSTGAEGRILRGAAQAFGRHGYVGTSVETILEAAGVSRRTFYRVFRSKAHVFEALYAHSLQVVFDSVAQAVQSHDEPMAKLEAAVAAYVDVNVRAGPVARVLLLEQFSPGSRPALQRERAVRAFIAMIEHECKAAGAPVDRLVVHGVVAGLNEIAVQMATEQAAEGWDVARVRRAMLRLLSVLTGGRRRTGD